MFVEKIKETSWKFLCLTSCDWYGTFLTCIISVCVYSSGKTKKHKKASKYKDLKNDLAAAIVQIKRSEEHNRKREREYQETVAVMKRRVQELEGRYPFSFIEFQNQF